MIAAKNCKVSADEARRIKSAITANKREYAAILEQREQVAKLVEKREMQLANIAAEVNLFGDLTSYQIYLIDFFCQDIKFDRELNVNLMDMGMTVSENTDPKVRTFWIGSLNLIIVSFLHVYNIFYRKL